MTLQDYAKGFIAWAKVHHRSWQKDDSRLTRALPVLGEKKLDEVATADIERFLASLLEGERALSPASVNRYRDLLSGMFKRAVRLGLAVANPVRGIPKLRGSGGRTIYLPLDGEEEAALLEALSPDLRPLFLVSLNTGLRWSAQAALRWRDADLLSGILTVRRSKNGRVQHLPMNSTVRSALIDVGAKRQSPGDPDEPIFVAAYRTVARVFERAVKAAQATLTSAG